MKIIHKQDFHKLKSKLTKADITTMVILKLSRPGEYIKGSGILYKDFYLITENKYDEIFAMNIAIDQSIESEEMAPDLRQGVY